MIRILSKEPAFGWESKNCNADEISGDQYLMRNMIKLASYLPGISVIVGIVNLIFCIANPEFRPPLRHIPRAFMSIAQMGPALFIIDAITTIGRQFLLQIESKNAFA